MPGDVLHHRRVAGEDGLRVHDLPFLWAGADVPKTDGLQSNERGAVRISVPLQLQKGEKAPHHWAHQLLLFYSTSNTGTYTLFHHGATSYFDKTYKITEYRWMW